MTSDSLPDDLLDEVPPDLLPEADFPNVSAADRPDDRLPRQVIGSLALVTGTLLLLLVFINQTTPLPLPRFWYANEWLWAFIGLALFPVGWAMHKLYPSAPERWQPAVPGQRFQRVIVYSRRECHLCEEVLEMLANYAEWLPPVEVVDIDTDPQLQAAHGLTIPVVECDGRVRFRGRISETLLRRLIEGTSPAGESQRESE